MKKIVSIIFTFIFICNVRSSQENNQALCTSRSSKSTTKQDFLLSRTLGLHQALMIAADQNSTEKFEELLFCQPAHSQKQILMFAHTMSNHSVPQKTDKTYYIKKSALFVLGGIAIAGLFYYLYNYSKHFATHYVL